MLSACGTDVGMVITPRNNVDIHSPNYPRNYPNNLNCVWHIIGVDKSRIELSLKGDELEDKYYITFRRT